MQTPPLAITGMACRLPGGITTPDALWTALLSGLDAIGPVPPDRWDAASFHDPISPRGGGIRNAVGAFLDQIDQFDAAFFGMFPAEARSVDPQQRLLLEVSVEAIEDAARPLESLRGSRTAAFIGSFMYDHMGLQLSTAHREDISPYVAMGAGMTSLANRVSYSLDLRGPSVSLDTACSSSLSAVHLACRALWAGDADAALAGGVNVILRPEGSMMLSAAGFLGPGGRCRAFDASADGYVRGEGAVVFHIEPLERALAAGRRVHSIIRGTAMTQDGHVQAGFTVPREAAQVAALQAAYTQAGVDPADIAYVEAHGPGTKVGDPIECRALGTVLGAGRPADKPCLVGSIKTNLGHLEGAAGAVGLLKAVLVARERQVPANLHFQTPNPDIPFSDLRLRVADAVQPLPGSGPARVGVNSFGAGGTNVHVVIEGPPVEPRRQPQPGTVLPFAVSGRSSAALAAQAATLQGVVTADTPLADLSWTLCNTRSQHPERVVVAATSADGLRAALDSVAQGKLPVGAARVPRAPDAKPRLGLIFSGQGGQWAGMGRALMTQEPVFRAALEDLEARFLARSGWSILAAMAPDAAAGSIDRTERAQPCIMAIQVALTTLLRSRGVTVDAVAGHSIGEVAAGWAAGSLTLDEAVEVIHGRSVIQARAAGGTLLATGLTEDEARAELRRHPDLDLAVINGPSMAVVGGRPGPLAVLRDALEAREVFARFVHVEVAYHTRWMEPLKNDLINILGHIHGRPATTPLYSTVTGERASGTHLGGDYWYRNVRETVRLHTAVEAMLDDGVTTFLEIGPHPVLTRGAAQTIARRGSSALVLPTHDKRTPGGGPMAVALGAIALRGHTLNPDPVWGPAPRAVPLPAYAWQRQRHWDEAAADRRDRLQARVHPLLRGRSGFITDPAHKRFDVHLSLDAARWLDDHRVDGAAVLPATGHLELALAAACEALGHGRVVVKDVRFESALVVPERGALPLEARLELRSADGDFALCSRVSGDDEAPWTIHSRGRIAATPGLEPAEDLQGIQARFAEVAPVAARDFYAAIAAAGLQYGPAFQCVQRLWTRPGEVLAELALPSDVGREAVPHAVHPALLDAALHAIFADVHARGDADRIYLPHTVARAQVLRSGLRTGFAHVRVHTNTPTWLVSDTVLYTMEGAEAARLDGLRCKHLPTQPSTGSPQRALVTTWESAPRTVGVRHTRGTLRVVLVGEGALAQSLEDRLTAVAGLASLRRLPPSELGPLAAPESPDALPSDLDRRTQVVFIADAAHPGDPTPAQQLLRVGQLLDKGELVPELVVVTRGGAAPHTDTVPAMAAVHGMARVLGNELPRVPVRTIDLGAHPDDNDLHALVEELLGWRADAHEGELRLSGGQREARTVTAHGPTALEHAHLTRVPAQGSPYSAEVGSPGVLDSVRFVREHPAPLGPEDVRIEVRAAALNFKDVMNAMGLLRPEAVAGGLSADQLGLEVAGVVVEVGSDIADVAAGQRVLARVRRGFAGQVCAHRSCVALLADTLAFPVAAAVPAASLTAWYGLVHLARIKPGETILVHSATGGVGRAAIAIAAMVGATVIATAGSPERRAQLRALGVAHVFDSRSVSFREGVQAATEGRGVDVVLNSLTGALLHASLNCLAPFGRFVEIGKTDIYTNSALGMRILGENISLFVVDVDRLALARPALHQQGLETVARLVGDGTLPPPVVTTLPMARLSEALQQMARSAHTGKLVVEATGEVNVAPLPAPRLSPTGTVLITGGASGLGLVLAGWLADRGTRSLALASRSGPKSAADEAAIHALRARGVTITLPRIDVTDAIAVGRLVKSFTDGSAPLTGIVHCAAVLDDRPVGDVDGASFARVWGPKAEGAWWLDRACRDAGAPLELFLLVSSISSVLGLTGQAAYATANAFLDGLAAARRADGLPGTSVNLGVLGDYAGMSKRSDDNRVVLDVLSTHGIDPVRLQPLLAALDATLGQDATQRAIVRLDWSKYLRAHPHLQRDTRYLPLADAAEGPADRGQGHREALCGLPANARPAALAARLAEALAGMLGADASAIDPMVPLDVLGLDSMVITQLRSWMLRELDLSVPMLKLLGGPTLAGLSTELSAQLEGDSANDGTKGGEDNAMESVLDESWARSLDPWLIESAQSPPDAAVTLVCFHSMGVGASLFAPFLARPPAGLRVLVVQTPGREERSGEAVLGEVSEVVDAAVARIRAHVSGPLLLWGHSFGGIVAHEVARSLLADTGVQPGHLLVTGTVAPCRIALWQQREVMLRVSVAENSADYLMALSRHVEDPAFVRAILPLMRPDTPLLMRYTPAPRPPLSIEIIAYAARQDDMVYPDEIQFWADHTHGGFELVEVDGDHWFLNRNRTALVDKLTHLAAQLVG